MTVNPIKIIVMIISLGDTFKAKYPALKFKCDSLKEELINIANAIIEESSTGDDIVLLVTDRLYNGLEVFDKIAYLDLHQILANPVMDNIVSGFYSSPYERVHLMNESTTFRMISEIYNESNDAG